MKFNELNLSEEILKALEQLSYDKVLEVQKQVIPHLLEYKDVLVQSKTGKTNNESLKVLEGKQELSSGDVIIGYTSKNGVNLLYKHSNEKGGAKEMANTGEETEEVVEETVEETVENVDNSVDKLSKLSTKQVFFVDNL